MPTFTRQAEKNLAELPPALRSRARAIANRLDAEPSLGKKLLGKLEGKRSVRLGRSHRIISTVDGGAVVVLAVLPRRDAYR